MDITLTFLEAGRLLHILDEHQAELELEPLNDEARYQLHIVENIKMAIGDAVYASFPPKRS